MHPQSFRVILKSSEHEKKAGNCIGKRTVLPERIFDVTEK
jgi:hypothetical protein